MLELPSDVGPSHRFVLGESERVTKGAFAPPLSVSGWVDLSEPAVTPLTKELIGADAELLAFWTAEAASHRYDYVTLACAFGPAEGQPFDKAWVEIDLTPIVGEAVAWSMAPREVVDQTDVSLKTKVGSEFKLLSADIEGGSEYKTQDRFLRAFKERSAKPYWEFRPTKQNPIAGSWRLSLVVRSAREGHGEGTVTLSTVVQTRRFLIFHANAPFGEPASVSFALPSLS